MSVLLPNTYLGVQRQGAMAEDSHGDSVPGSLLPLVGPFPGRARGGGGRLSGGFEAESLALDPQCWPFLPKDVVVETTADGEPTGRTWTVGSADLMANSEDHSVDYVRCIGQLRVGASTSP